MESRWRTKLDPSGETFINQLILFIDSRGSQLISQKSALKLQPRALEYLAFRLASLRDLQKIKTTNPMDFIAGAVSDLGTYKRMEKIQVIIIFLKLKKIKLQKLIKGIFGKCEAFKVVFIDAGCPRSDASGPDTLPVTHGLGIERL